MNNLNDFIAKLTDHLTEDSSYTLEELEGIAKSSTEKDNKILSLEEQVKKLEEEKSTIASQYDNLRNRVVDRLFDNPKGNSTNNEVPKEPEEVVKKQFKDLINPDYQIKN